MFPSLRVRMAQKNRRHANHTKVIALRTGVICTLRVLPDHRLAGYAVPIEIGQLWAPQAITAYRSRALIAALTSEHQPERRNERGLINPIFNDSCQIGHQHCVAVNGWETALLAKRRIGDLG